MATSVAALANVATVTPACMQAAPSLKALRSAAPSLRISKSAMRGVRCEQKDPLSPIKDAVSDTKVDINSTIGDRSEEASVFGTKPTSGGTYPRPESERRPELGNTSFGSVMAFDGPGPETMNGRLAMTGAAWAVVSELISHQTIVEQVTAPGSPGLFWLLATAQLIIFASLVPIFNGESPDSRKNGPFTAKAERWNGRVAMIGFAGLLIFENFAHRPFF